MVLQAPRVWLLTLIACFIPLLWLFVDIALNYLGANPIQAIHIRLGDWALRFLCLTLVITPLQSTSQWRGLTKYRQLFGLCSFFYATLHLLVYLLVDHALNWVNISTDIIESVYVWFGLLTYIILLLLALTSSKSAKKRLGKYWKKLHRLIYLAVCAAIIHYFWQLKGSLAEPLFYSVMVVLLLAARSLSWLKNLQWRVGKQ